MADLLEGGRFSSDDYLIVGRLITLSMGMFIGASMGELLARGFYVLGDTRSPTLIGVVSLTIGLVLKYLLFKNIGIWGIAIGVSIYYLLSASSLTLLLAKRMTLGVYRGLPAVVAQALAASLAACAACYVIYEYGGGSTWLAAPVGGVTYLLGLLLMRNEDAHLIWREVWQRISLLGKRN